MFLTFLHFYEYFGSVLTGNQASLSLSKVLVGTKEKLENYPRYQGQKLFKAISVILVGYGGKEFVFQDEALCIWALENLFNIFEQLKSQIDHAKETIISIEDDLLYQLQKSKYRGSVPNVWQLYSWGRKKMFCENSAEKIMSKATVCKGIHYALVKTKKW